MRIIDLIKTLQEYPTDTVVFIANDEEHNVIGEGEFDYYKDSGELVIYPNDEMEESFEV